MSAVSNVVIPSSSAARTQASAASFSICDPCVIQLPYEISLTTSPLCPKCRWFMLPQLQTCHSLACHSERSQESRPALDPKLLSKTTPAFRTANLTATLPASANPHQRTVRTGGLFKVRLFFLKNLC